MILIALVIGVILIVAAVRNSQAALFTALGQDVPAYIVWAAAIFAVGAVGWIPGLKPVSRGLLALVILVLILRNYQAILAGFSDAWQNAPAVAGPSDASGGGGVSGSAGLSLPDLGNLHLGELDPTSVGLPVPTLNGFGGQSASIGGMK